VSFFTPPKNIAGDRKKRLEWANIHPCAAKPLKEENLIARPAGRAIRRTGVRRGWILSHSKKEIFWKNSIS